MVEEIVEIPSHPVKFILFSTILLFLVLNVHYGHCWEIFLLPLLLILPEYLLDSRLPCCRIRVKTFPL